MKRPFLIVIWALLFPTDVHTQDTPLLNPITVENIRYQTYSTHTRVVLDLNQPPLYQIDRESQWISIHLSNTTLGENLKDKPVLLLQGLLEKVEVKEEGPLDVFILLTFKNPGPHETLILTHPDRLVLDVTRLETPPTEKKETASPVPSIPPPFSLEINTIVIDPGHGGDAPGAIGPTGLTEAEVVLDVAWRVKKIIEQRLHKKVILTRDRDIFIPLHERTEIANTNKADLFVSIHANASPRKSAQGVETYLFGQATDETALATAARENATDIKAAQNFQEVILNDLERDFNLNLALELAHYTQEAFVKKFIPKYSTFSLGVKKAPFYVLAHTKMPAILAEISFISNKIEERRLRQKGYRQEIAELIVQGITGYIEGNKNP